MLPNLGRLSLQQADTRVVFTYDDTEKWDKAYKQKFQENECPVCFEKFKRGDEIVVLECGHVFCGECFRQWDQNKRNCPLCRKRVEDDELLTPEGLFLKAAKVGNLAKVTQMLKDGIDVNAHDENDTTALMWACVNEHTHVALALLKHKDIKVDLANIKGETALHRTSYQGMLKVVEELIEKGANANKQDKDGHTALIQACINEHTHVALALLEREDINVDLVNKYGHTALQWASFKGMLEVVEKLIEKGADVNKQNKDGYTALIMACDRGMLVVVEKLIEKGADVNVQDAYGNTALLAACRKEHTDVALALLSHEDINVDLAAKDWAFKNKMTEVVERIREIESRRASDDPSPMDVDVVSPNDRPKLTDDTFKTAISAASAKEWTHPEYGHISYWDVSQVTDMNRAFKDKETFNEDIHLWNVSSVTDMSNMFQGAESFNQPLDWDVSSVTNMGGMFSNTDIFNQPLNWDVSNVDIMYAMFANARAFNQPLNWDVSSVTDMSDMFQGASEFNQPLNWDVSSVTDMGWMFAHTDEFNQPLNWDVSSVTDMRAMFRGASEFNQPLNWDVSSVTDMRAMFRGAYAFNQPLNWDVSSVTDMKYMFQGAHAFNQPLNWDVSSVTNMSEMFEDSAQDPPPEWYDGT